MREVFYTNLSTLLPPLHRERGVVTVADLHGRGEGAVVGHVEGGHGEEVRDERALDHVVERAGRVQRRRDVHLQQPRPQPLVQQHVEPEQLVARVPATRVIL